MQLVINKPNYSESTEKILLPIEIVLEIDVGLILQRFPLQLIWFSRQDTNSAYSVFM